MALDDKLCRGDDGVEMLGETFDPTEEVCECNVCKRDGIAEGTYSADTGFSDNLAVESRCVSGSLRLRLVSLLVFAGFALPLFGLSITSALSVADVIFEDDEPVGIARELSDKLWTPKLFSSVRK